MKENKRKNKKKKILILVSGIILLALIIAAVVAIIDFNERIPSIGDVKPTSSFASPVNKALFEYERSEFNDTDAMNKAILARGGSPLNTCVLFQANALRAIGINVPENITYTTNLAQYLEQNGWQKETDFNNLQSGDICFAGNTHTFLFMGWRNKAKNLAYVMGDESYMFPETYMVRNLNGQEASSSNGNNAQYQTTFYLKYVGSPVKLNKINDNSNVVKNSLGRVSVKSPDGLWMTSAMSDSSKKLVCLDDNIILYVLKSENGWYEVYYNGQIGYVQSQYTTGLGNPIANSSENVEDLDAGVNNTN